MLLYLLILLIGGLLAAVGPWWIMAPVCFGLCFFLARSASRAFRISAWAGVTLWVGYSLYLHLKAEADLAGRVAGIFTGGMSGVPGIVVVAAIAALVAGLVCGFSGLAGAKMRQLIRRLRE